MKWIKVKDEIPDRSETVLTFSVGEGFRIMSSFAGMRPFPVGVTHWARMEPPALTDNKPQVSICSDCPCDYCTVSFDKCDRWPWACKDFRGRKLQPCG